MAQFKVKYKERHALARSLKREVKTLGLVDTWAMHDGIRIAATSDVTMNGINLTIVVPYYFVFQDQGTRYIAAKNIVPKWLDRPKSENVLVEILQQYMAWRIENFKIFTDPNALTDIPAIRVNYELYGDPSGKYNGPYSGTGKTY